MFLQRLTFSDVMPEISAKTRLALHLKFTLLLCDLGQNVKVWTVRLPNIISFVKCTGGFFEFYHTGRQT